MQVRALLMSLLLAISCSKDSKKSVVSREQIEKDKISELRKHFKENEFEEMRSEISDTLETFQEFNRVKQNASTQKGIDFRAINELDQVFLEEHGTRAKELKAHFDELSERFSRLSQQAESYKVEIENRKTAYTNTKEKFENCKLDVESQKRVIDQRLVTFNNEMRNYQNRINAHKDSIDSHKKTVAKYKKKANRSNWPNDKREYRKRATKAAKRAQKEANAAQEVVNQANSRKAEVERELNPKLQTAEKKVLDCKNYVSVAEELHGQLSEAVRDYESTTEKLIEIKIQIEADREKNTDFFDAYSDYIGQRDVLTQGLQTKLNSLAQKFKQKQKELILNYGRNYQDSYTKIKQWLQSTELSGEKTMELLNYLDRRKLLTKKLPKLVDAIKSILLEVEITQNSRAVSSIIGDLIGIDINLANINLVNISISDLKIDLGDLNISLPSLSLSSIDIVLPEMNLSDVRIAHLEVGEVKLKLVIPDIKIMHVSMDVDGVFSRFLDDLGDFQVPEVKIIHIEADIREDLGAPGNILNNSNREFTRLKADADRELTIAYQNLKNTHDKAFSDVQREIGSGLLKTANALKAAGRPENLGRMALVYTASLYAGPFGAAMANAMLDKLENPQISDQDLFNSFVTGAAAGYAGEAVGGAQIETLQSMPNAASAIARNLTQDAGSVLLRGESYSAEQFLMSVTTGAANISTGDSFVAEVVDSTLNAGKDYTLNSLINEKGFDKEGFDRAVYEGLAQGVTRETMHAIVDKYVAPHIPKRVDKVVIEDLGNFLADLFEAEELTARQAEIEAFTNLSPSEQEKYIADMGEIYEKAINDFGGDYQVAFLLGDIDKVEGVLTSYVDGNPEAYAKFVEIQSRLNIHYEGVAPASAFKFVAVAVSTYFFCQTIEQTIELKKKYEASNQEPLVFLQENKVEISLIGADLLTTALPALAFLKSGKQVGKLLFSARKLGYKTKEQLSKFTDLLKRTVGNETGAWGKIDEWTEPVGKALIQTKPRISNHALQRFAERGITEGMVNKSLEKGTKYLDKLNKSVSYILESGFASGKTMQTVVDMGENTVITVNRIRKFNKNTKLPNGTLRWIEVSSLK